MASSIQVIEADITTLAVDAIVNAANQSLLGGGGVDGAIHRAAGPSLLEECRAIAQLRPGVRCPTGEARITRGHDLPAKWVIHTVGPVWQGGGAHEDELLASCYRNSLELAAGRGIKSVAFPAISTGAYRFPLERAAGIAARTVQEWIGNRPVLERVLFCCFGREASAAYEAAVKAASV